MVVWLVVEMVDAVAVELVAMTAALLEFQWVAVTGGMSAESAVGLTVLVPVDTMAAMKGA